MGLCLRLHRSRRTLSRRRRGGDAGIACNARGNGGMVARLEPSVGCNVDLVDLTRAELPLVGRCCGSAWSSSTESRCAACVGGRHDLALARLRFVLPRAPGPPGTRRPTAPGAHGLIDADRYPHFTARGALAIPGTSAGRDVATPCATSRTTNCHACMRHHVRRQSSFA